MFRKKYILIISIFFLSSCSLLSEEQKNYNRERARDHKARGIDPDTWSPLRVEHVNHTKLEILNVELDGANTRSTGHVWLPHKWRPGMTVTVDWDVDPNPGAFTFQIGLDTEGHKIQEKAYQTHISKYIHHQAVVSVPPYISRDLCAVAAHILPENKVGLAVSCNGYGINNYHL